MIYFLFITLISFNYQNILPNDQYPWTVQLIASEDMIDTWIFSDSIYSQTSEYAYCYQVPGFYNGKRIFRGCVGGYSSYEKAKEDYQYLTSYGFECIPREMHNLVLGSTGRITVNENNIGLSTGEPFRTDETRYGLRAYLSPDNMWAALIYPTGTGFENEGECIIMTRISDGQERLFLIESEMVFPQLWKTSVNPDGTESLKIIISTENGGVGYGSIYLIDVESGNLISKIENSSVTEIRENSVLYEIFGIEGETPVGSGELRI